MTALKRWRDVIIPHPDVAEGRYRNAEFAADLAEVASGRAAPEYSDPAEFFSRTYVTEGMKGLLSQALKRVCGHGGEPVIQLKTAFGGGKTHSMLALYHLMRGRMALSAAPALRPVLAEAGLKELPRANVVAIVGTALDPNKGRVEPGLPGRRINTLWGEIGAQLAVATGEAALYDDYVAEADSNGVSPGADTLRRLFDAAAPALVLMDELVAYARKLRTEKTLPAGTFENFTSFIQELTEAAKNSQCGMVVATIPESEIEVGDQAGQVALKTIEHTFGRLESIWNPILPNEGFEIVRRRLFLECRDTAERDRTCAEFSRMYGLHEGDFPAGVKELDYEKRLVSCYPIHPEIFDRLYEDWGALPDFQRTRGVLRLMAAVIHKLWMDGDANPMIMPGSLPLYAAGVRDELTRYLGANWNAIIDSEVDGPNSVPFKTDQATQSYGQQAASRKLARAIMLGSAPSQGQNVRGIEIAHVRLGVAQPGDKIFVFNDALATLQDSLTFLYANGGQDRFWYDTSASLRKTVADRERQRSEADAAEEIEKRLGALRRGPGGLLAAIHTCPASPADVPDEQSARLVVLGPSQPYSAMEPECEAVAAARAILDKKGAGRRAWRNTLVFLAPRKTRLEGLYRAAKRYLAWKSIEGDIADLNLTAQQVTEARKGLERAGKDLETQIQMAWDCLLAPRAERDAASQEVEWECLPLDGANEGLIHRATRKLSESEAVIERWSPKLLRMELDNLLWQGADHITVKDLWEKLCAYCYLPRLAGERALLEAIAAGLGTEFALASGFESGRYLNLQFSQVVGAIGKSDLLVKIEVADGQRPQPAPTPKPGPEDMPGPGPRPGPGPEPPAPSDAPKTRFILTAELDPARPVKSVNQLADDILAHVLSCQPGKVSISLEADITAPEGFPPDLVKTVEENCKAAKIHRGFFE